MDSLSGGITVKKVFCHPLEKVFMLKEIFPFSIDPFSEGEQCAGKKNGRKSTKCIPSL